MPFVTEEIYQSYFREREKTKSLHLAEWPDAKKLDQDLIAFGDSLIAVISAVRKAKSAASASMKAPVKRLVLNTDEKKTKPYLDDLKAVLSAEILEFGDELKIEL